jgi:lambda repressor-like predicted transcriptional regulator
VESIKKVRLKFHRKGESIAEIVRSTGLARNTVRSIIRGNHTKGTNHIRAKKLSKAVSIAV